MATQFPRNAEITAIASALTAESVTVSAFRALDRGTAKYKAVETHFKNRYGQPSVEPSRTRLRHLALEANLAGLI